jgi:phospholipase C
MTSAFDFARRPRVGWPQLPDPRPKMEAAIAQCGPNMALGTAEMGAPFPVPPNRMPVQAPGTRRAPSG